MTTTATRQIVNIPGGNVPAPALLIPVVALNHASSVYSAPDTNAIYSCDTTAGVLTIDLPTGAATGRQIWIADATAQAAANNITVTTAGAELIIGAASLVLNVNYQSVLLVFNGTNWMVF